MWQCDNCGYTDEDAAKFEEETQEGLDDSVRYCPECGSDEVFMVDDEEVEAGEVVLAEEPAEVDDEVDDWEEIEGQDESLV